MKKLTKSLSLFLCAVILFTSLPITALAQINAPYNLRCEKNEWDENVLKWDYNGNDYNKFNIYVSLDGVNYTLEATNTYANTEYCLPYDLTKGVYYYYVTAVKNEYYDYYEVDGSYDTGYYQYGDYYYSSPQYEAVLVPGEESAASNIVTVAVYDLITPYCYVGYDNGQLLVDWDISQSELNRIDGFTVYQSTNGSEFTAVSQIATSSFYSVSGSSYYFRYAVNTANTPSSYKFVVASYTNLAGVTYTQPDFTRFDSYTIYMPDPTLTTKTKSQVIKWSKVDGADSYVIYGSKSSKEPKAIATVSASTTKYTVKNVNNYKYDYIYYVAAVKNGVEFTKTYNAYSSDGEARFRAAAKKKKNKSSVTVVNTRKKKNSTAWTVTITKKDKKILDKFAKKHFKKGWTKLQKAQYTLEWINKNVSYAYGGKYNKIAKCSYVEAIFNKKCGQCLQYNGAYAMFLTYLGYEARIVQGWRGSSMKDKWSHYWCEIKIDGKWYLMETGNYEDSGNWMYFCSPYRRASGYIINTKVAK